MGRLVVGGKYVLRDCAAGRGSLAVGTARSGGLSLEDAPEAFRTFCDKQDGCIKVASGRDSSELP